MKILLPRDYIKAATAEVKKAKRRVLLLSMVVADHPATHPLISAIEDAARRGVKVTVAADTFTYGEVSGSFLPVRYYSPNGRLATKMGKDLKAAGVNFHWLGRARVTLFNGRTHSKWCIADDTVFTFGGVNTYQGGIENVDYMFQITNPQLADRLEQEQHRIQRAEARATNYPSTSYPTKDGTVLIDGGIIAHSIIYKRACELAKQATNILYVSQYCPTGKLARIMKRKSSHTYFNYPEKADFINRMFMKFSIGTSGLKNRYRRTKPYLHAKFIIFTLPGGKKVAITGSHNFAFTGVLFGTREIALETSNKITIRQLERFFKEHLA